MIKNPQASHNLEITEDNGVAKPEISFHLEKYFRNLVYSFKPSKKARH